MHVAHRTIYIELRKIYQTGHLYRWTLISTVNTAMAFFLPQSPCKEAPPPKFILLRSPYYMSHLNSQVPFFPPFTISTLLPSSKLRLPASKIAVVNTVFAKVGNDL